MARESIVILDSEVAAVKRPVMPKIAPYSVLSDVTSRVVKATKEPIAQKADKALDMAVSLNAEAQMLAAYADTVASYIKEIRIRGLDTNYIRDNATLIKELFFELLDKREGGGNGQTKE